MITVSCQGNQVYYSRSLINCVHAKTCLALHLHFLIIGYNTQAFDAEIIALIAYMLARQNEESKNQLDTTTSDFNLSY